MLCRITHFFSKQMEVHMRASLLCMFFLAIAFVPVMESAVAVSYGGIGCEAAVMCQLGESIEGGGPESNAALYCENNDRVDWSDREGSEQSSELMTYGVFLPACVMFASYLARAS
jgi:hypothetical protein